MCVPIMKTRIRLISFFFSMVVTFASCIEEYSIPDEIKKNYKKQLVVNASIFSGDKSTIYLSYTTSIGSFHKGEPALNADITIIGENGYVSPKAEYDKENKRYLIPTYELPNNTLYALKILYEGDTYQSEFQPLLLPPEIEKVTWRELDDGVGLYVSTSGEDVNHRNYLWTYEEDWEIHTEMDFTRPLSQGQYWYSKQKYTIGNNGKNPYMYCWMRNESAVINIYTTKKLQTNKVIDHQFLHIPINDIRISYIYSILVKQACLSDQVYNYYDLMQLYFQNSGGLFTPMPTEIEGNLKCISNPSKKIYGVVFASKISTKRIFIYESDFKKLSPEYTNCHPIMGGDLYTGDLQNDAGWRNAWTKEVTNGAFIYITSSEDLSFLPHTELNQFAILYPATCMDCRKTNGATKQRPYFWPNNHE